MASIIYLTSDVIIATKNCVIAKKLAKTKKLGPIAKYLKKFMNFSVNTDGFDNSLSIIKSANGIIETTDEEITIA